MLTTKFNSNHALPMLMVDHRSALGCGVPAIKTSPGNRLAWAFPIILLGPIATTRWPLFARVVCVVWGLLGASYGSFWSTLRNGLLRGVFQNDHGFYDGKRMWSSLKILACQCVFRLVLRRALLLSFISFGRSSDGKFFRNPDTKISWQIRYKLA